MKKIIFILYVFVFYLPTVFAEKSVLPFFDKLQRHSLHSNEKNEINGSSTEFHLKDEQYYYLYTKLYNIKENSEEKKMYKHRLIVFNLQKVLTYFYEKNHKKNEIFFNHYSKVENRYYKKEDQKEWQVKKKIAGRKFTGEEFFIELKNKILQKNFEKAVWDFYLPYGPVSNVTMNIYCQTEEQNPFLGKKEPVVICKFSPKSKAIRFLLSKKKLRNIFVFKQEYPYQILEIVLGNNHFYLTENRPLLMQDKVKLLQEINAIKETFPTIQ